MVDRVDVVGVVRVGDFDLVLANQFLSFSLSSLHQGFMAGALAMVGEKDCGVVVGGDDEFGCCMTALLCTSQVHARQPGLCTPAGPMRSVMSDLCSS